MNGIKTNKRIVEISKSEDGWELKVGDGEKAEMAVFADECYLVTPGEYISLEDILKDYGI